MYGIIFCYGGRIAEGLQETGRALTMDPLSSIASLQQEWCLYIGGRYREVIDQHRRTLAIDPRFFYLES